MKLRWFQTCDENGVWAEAILQIQNEDYEWEDVPIIALTHKELREGKNNTTYFNIYSKKKVEEKFDYQKLMELNTCKERIEKLETLLKEIKPHLPYESYLWNKIDIIFKENKIQGE